MALTPEPLDKLCAEHAKKIDELRELVALELPGETGDGVLTDEIFLLRFVLSNKKNLEKAADKIMKTLEWRKENQKLLSALANGEPHPLQADVSRFLFSGYTGSMKTGEPISVVRLGSSNFRTLMNTYSVETIAEYLLYEKEKAFRMCDKETRSRGHLVKSITVIDFQGFAMFGGNFDNRFFTALGNSSKLSSIYFPQLQVKTVAINTPSYYSMIHKTLSATMPKSSMEKMVLCPAKKTHQQSGESCPFLKQYGGLDAVPKFLGGTGKTPRELQPPSEREGEVPFDVVRIKPRSFAMVELPIEVRDTVVEFEVQVDSFHVLMLAEVAPFKKGERLEHSFSKLTNSESMMSRDSSDDGGVEEAKEKQQHTIAHHKSERKKRRWKPRRARQMKNSDAEATSSTKRMSLNPQMSALKLTYKDGVVKGTWRIPITGHLLIKFDNSFSRLRSKTVSFKICTVPPPEDPEEKTWLEENWPVFANQAQWPSTPDDDWQCVIS